MRSDDSDPTEDLGSERLARSLVLVDGLIAKAAGASMEQRFLAMEMRALRTFEETWADRAEDAVGACLRTLQGDAPANSADVTRVLFKMEDSFNGWAAEVAPMVKAVTGETYKLAKQQIARRAAGRVGAIQPLSVEKADATAEYSFTLADKRAIAAIQRNQLHWIGEHYDDVISLAIRDTVRRTMLEQGLGRKAAGKALEPVLRGAFGIGSQPKRYFEGLAANVATTARVHGAVREMAEIGVTTMEIVNPIDERTCDRCHFMDGRKVSIRYALAVADAVLAARTPAQAKAAHPWAKDVDVLRRADKAGRLERDFPLPSYHFRCRCTVDISEDVE